MDFFRLRLFLVLLIWLLFVWSSPFVRAEQPLKPVAVGTRIQLLVDDHVVASRRNLVRRLGTVTKQNGGRPIFTDGCFYGTVLYDEGRFKMWWRKPGQVGFGYSESKDGLRFTSKADVTGINFAGDFTLSVMIDPRETDPAHRYKAAYDAPGMAAGLAYSRDGIRWTTYNRGRPVTKRAADTYNFLLWDEAAATYRLFTRTDFGTSGGQGEWRGTRMMVNADPKQHPLKWKTVRNWVFDRDGKKESRRRQIYSVTDWMRHGVHFGLMSVYEWPSDFSEGGPDKVKRHERDVMNFYIATSRDADSWDLSWIYAGQPIVPRGPSGSFDKDLLIPASSIVTHAGRHWLYYCGANERHGDPTFKMQRDHAIGVATIGEDRLVGLEAADHGVLLTRPFRLDGKHLVLNSVVQKGGRLRVAVLDSEGHARPGFAADQSRSSGGDHPVNRVRWSGKARLASLAGKTIRLKFDIRRAILYSFRIAK
ncbi:MAG: hypothetical protein VB859_11720 [Planctomycetaceae bacterium]